MRLGVSTNAVRGQQQARNDQAGKISTAVDDERVRVHAEDVRQGAELDPTDVDLGLVVVMMSRAVRVYVGLEAFDAAHDGVLHGADEVLGHDARSGTVKHRRTDRKVRWHPQVWNMLAGVEWHSQNTQALHESVMSTSEKMSPVQCTE